MIAALPRVRGGTLRRFMAFGMCMMFISCGDSQGPRQLLQFRIYPEDAFVLYLSNVNEIYLSDDSHNFGGRSELVYTFKAVSVDPDGVIKFRIIVKTAEYPALLEPLGPALEGQAFSARMAPSGEFLEFLGTEHMRRAVSEKLVFDWIKEPGDRLEAAKEKYLRYIDDDSLRGLFEPLFRVWPTTPAATGDTWTRENIPLFLSPLPVASVSTSFEVTSWERGEVTLSLEGKIGTQESNASGDVSGSSHGTIKIDPVRGFIKSISMEREASGTFRSSPSSEDWVPIRIHEEIFAELLQL